ncbi:MAG: hypothetical protein L0271_23210, partial [Gemmatimonadetes bacterium]|nr:hypothetical protein [Gemmatimonadota bacterium]
MSQRRLVSILLRAPRLLVAALLLVAIPAPAASLDSNGPEEAVRALEQGRFLHASLILREHFSTVRDTTPADLVLAARAEGGWGNWERVVQLLSGRAWLDTLDHAIGWELLGYAHGGLENWKESRSAFTRFLALGPSDDARRRGRAEIARATAHARNAETADALAALASARELLPSIAGWIALEAAAASAAAGDTASVHTLLAGIDAVLAREWGWRHRVESLKKAGLAARAVAAAEAAANEPGPAGRRAAAWVEAGRLHLEAGDDARARAAFRNAMATAPGTSSGVDGARLLSELS